MRIAMTGSSGLVGSALRREFGSRQWHVTRVARPSGSKAAGAIRWDIGAGTIDAAGLEDHDVVLHLAGESLAGLWTRAKKHRIMHSREVGTDLLARALAGLERKPRLLVSWSAVGYYGDRDPSVPLTEDASPGSGFLADVCVRWEAATAAASDAGIRVVHLRTGLVLTPEGSVLKPILPLFRLGLGAVLGSGKQPWPWLTLDEIVAITLHVIETPDLSGPVNAVAPEIVNNEQFTKALAAAVDRFALIRAPAWALRRLPRGMADELLLSGAPVVPARLRDTGYTFRWPELGPALSSMLV